MTKHERARLSAWVTAAFRLVVLVALASHARLESSANALIALGFFIAVLTVIPESIALERSGEHDATQSLR